MHIIKLKKTINFKKRVLNIIIVINWSLLRKTGLTPSSKARIVHNSIIPWRPKLWDKLYSP